MRRTMLAFAIVLSLLIGSLPAARAEEKNFGAALSLLEPAAENQAPPDLSEGTVWSDATQGPDGSQISASITWEDMPERNGLPTFNADRTFYPGDALRVQIVGNRTNWYKNYVAVAGLCGGVVNVGNAFDERTILQIPAEAEPGLGGLSFGLYPEDGSLSITALDENEEATREIYIDNALVGTGSTTVQVPQGAHTVSFEGNPPENVIAPQPTTVTLTPARRIRIVAHYEYENAEFDARTEVYTEENGAPDLLPTLWVELRVRIVPYRPKFVVVPYTCLSWEGKNEIPQSSYDLPFAVLVRFDGNQFDPENENRISLDQRALVDDFSLSGGAAWPLRAAVRQPQLRDLVSPDATLVLFPQKPSPEKGLVLAEVYADYMLLGAPPNPYLGVIKEVPSGVHLLHFENSGGYYAPPDICVEVPPGLTVRVFAYYSSEPQSELRENSYAFEVRAENGETIDVAPAHGPPSSFPGYKNPYYRTDGSGNLLYYEAGDVVYDDNGAPKLETAKVDARLETFLGGSPDAWFALSAPGGYETPENLRERVVLDRGARFGAGEWSGVILRAGGSPFVFDRDHRYYKFVFTLEGSARDWVAYGEGTLTLEVSLLSAAHGKTIKTGIEWSPLGLVQPVAVRAWRLAPWARELAENDPQVLYLDNAWMVDDRVGFEVRFVPLYDAENFMRLAHEFAENAAPALENFFGSSENMETIMLPTLENVMGNIGAEFQNLLSGQQFDIQEMISAARSALYSLSNIDNYMLDTMIKDVGWENKEPQVVSGEGEASATVERRGLSVFAVEESAWVAGENARVKSEMVDLPFDSEKEFAFDINLSGEGMAVEIATDTGAMLELRLHAPPKSGGLQRVRILDNQGRQLFQRDFLPPSLSRLSGVFGTLGTLGLGTSAENESPQTIALQKSPATPTEIYVELTNFWGASSVRKLSILPYAPSGGVEPGMWGWLIAAGIFMAAWVAFVNWLRDRRARQI